MFHKFPPLLSQIVRMSPPSYNECEIQPGSPIEMASPLLMESSDSDSPGEESKNCHIHNQAELRKKILSIQTNCKLSANEKARMMQVKIFLM
jgi:hypothetical protein